LLVALAFRQRRSGCCHIEGSLEESLTSQAIPSRERSEFTAFFDVFPKKPSRKGRLFLLNEQPVVSGQRSAVSSFPTANR